MNSNVFHIYVLTGKTNINLFMFVLPFFVLLSTKAFAVDEINAEGQVALHGYDPVAYFDRQPEEGKYSIFSVYNQIKYYFSSLTNKNKFDQDPEHYVPVYGSYCAYGVRMGKKFDNDPFAYEIVDGRLYVLLNRMTQKIWQQDRQKNIQISDRIWPQLMSKSVESLNSELP